MNEIQQTSALPATYNSDEIARKEEQERQLLTMDKKVDRVIYLLEGDGDSSPGLANRIHKMEKTVYGNGEMGLQTRMTIMWRAWVWFLCTMSAGIGFVANEIVKSLHK